ncbi:MAG TPA: ClpXP protease specificity-enhancing factor SspB [Sphingomonadales bacterium]|nr:ClpXP protease specificity-enhancing factor SspB [Sphingomonadales bacterium]
MPMRKSHIDYQALVHRALRGTVRDILQQVAKEGLKGEQHYYITFKTDFEGVAVPPYLKAKYPKEMTVVIQHRFWDLKVESDRFRITLSFNQKAEMLAIPFDAITSLVDPSVRFALQFETEVPEEEEQPPLLKHAKPAPAASQENQPAAKTGTEDAKAGGNVVALDAFRKP